MSSNSFEIAADLRRSLARLNRRLRLEARETGLTVAKHSILGRLYRDGPTTPGALAAAEGVQPQSITRVLAELEYSGLALRRQDEIDRRQFKIEITPEGRELVQREARNRALWLATAMDTSLTVIEQEVLRLATKIMDKVADVPASDSSGSQS
jgi:DNA-binding MarR family transcriptional regulator